MLGRTATLGLSLSAFGTLASACGGNDDGGDGASQATAVTVGLFDHHKLIDEAVAPVFERKTGIKPTLEPIVAADHHDELVSAFRTDTSLWDTVPLWNWTVPEMAHGGWLMDLSGFIEETFGGDFDQFVAGSNLFQSARYQDGIYGIPVDVGGALLHFNRARLEEAGLDPDAPHAWHANPGSIDDFISYAKALTIGEGSWGFADNWAEQGVISFNTYVLQHGGKMFDLSKNAPWGEITFNQEPGVQALEFMVDLLHTHKAIDPASVTYNWVFDVLPGFLDGRTAMMMSYPFVAHTAKNPEESKIVDTADFAPLWAAETSGTTEGTEFIAVPKLAPNGTDAGLEYVKFRTSIEGMRIQGEQGVWAPIYKSLYEEPKISDAFFEAETMIQSLEYPSDPAVTPDRAEVWVIVGAALQEALSRKKSPTEALNDAAKQLEDSRAANS